MGYTTDFDGRFNLNRKLTKTLHTYLTKFSESRRMARTLGPEFGVEGEFYVDGKDGNPFGERAPDIIDYNRPPKTQPGLWCQWVPTEDGLGIEWDGNEKFYKYVEWLKYLINNFLAPEGYVVNGDVKWRGEEFSDIGTIQVQNNVVTVVAGW